jgi:hypothetical protein
MAALYSSQCQLYSQLLLVEVWAVKLHSERIGIWPYGDFLVISNPHG